MNTTPITVIRYAYATTTILLFVTLLQLFSGCRPLSDTVMPDEPDANAVKVLFIGNSITYYNDMPAIFKAMAVFSGKNVYVDQSVKGGAMLTYFQDDPATLDKINYTDWDYVILQDGNYHIVSPEFHTWLSQPVLALKNKILANEPDTVILFHMLHALRGGVDHDGVHYDYETFQNMLIGQTPIFAENLGLITAPVGVAWKRVVDERTDIDLYKPDNMHPSIVGSYLIACVYYSIIFNERYEKDIPVLGLSRGRADYIQTVAYETVCGSKTK